MNILLGKNSPKSTVRDVFPNLSYINCLVHLYVEILQFFKLSILLWVVRMVCVSPFWTGVLGEIATAVGIQISFISILTPYHLIK